MYAELELGIKVSVSLSLTFTCPCIKECNSIFCFQTRQSKIFSCKDVIGFLLSVNGPALLDTSKIVIHIPFHREKTKA